MKLQGIRGGSVEELESKQYNICIGISLGNKWFTPENILSLIQWSLVRTREYVIVCPADEIHAINIAVRKRINSEKALKQAREMGKEIVDEVKKLASTTLSEAENERIVYATWLDVITEDYKEKTKYLYEEFERNPLFQERIKNIVLNYVSREERSYTEQEIYNFCTYIIEEMMEVTSRISIKGVVCDAHVYPYDGELAVFIESLQRGECFPEIREAIMNTEPKVFLEVR